MIVYASPSFREKHPQTWKNIQAAKSTPWCNSYVAHQLLELAGIHTPSFNPQLVLFKAE
ncbi:MAG: hypothetical protein K2K37_04725 [Muribaculaceae bacterium]|nr:hypothetical protein [Muribaculaceae bacterium]